MDLFILSTHNTRSNFDYDTLTFLRKIPTQIFYSSELVDHHLKTEIYISTRHLFSSTKIQEFFLNTVFDYKKNQILHHRRRKRFTLYIRETLSSSPGLTAGFYVIIIIIIIIVIKLTMTWAWWRDRARKVSKPVLDSFRLVSLSLPPPPPLPVR